MRASGLGAALVSALLLLSSTPPWPAGPVVLVALVPWAVHLARLPEGATGAAEAGRSGAALFSTFWALNLAWVLLLAPRLGVWWPVPAWLGQVLLLTSMGWGTGRAVHGLLHRLKVPLPLALALGWMGWEWARGHLLGPLRFPWWPLALPLTPHPPLLQPAAWVGETGLGLLVAGFNGAVAAVWLAGEGDVPGGARPLGRIRIRRVVGMGVLLLGLAGWWGVGARRQGALERVPVVRVAAVQPAIPLAEKRSGRGDGAARTRSLLDSAWSAEAPAGQVDVLVLPETHLPGTLVLAGPEGGPVFAAATDGGAGPGAAGVGGASGTRRRQTQLPDPVTATEWEAVQGWAPSTEVALLVGAFVEDPTGAYNGLVWIEGGEVRGVYRKRALVPGVERAPGSRLRPGPAPVPLGAAGRPGALICIESAWGGLARAHARTGAGWLVNVTNDAWLGDVDPWTRTPAFHQHPGHLVLRSVETGLGALRVGTGGWTGVVGPAGRWTPLLPPFRPGLARGTVERSAAPTLYVRFGDLLGPLSALMALLGLVGRPGRAHSR